MTTPQQRLEEIAKQELALTEEKATLLAALKDADFKISVIREVDWTISLR